MKSIFNDPTLQFELVRTMGHAPYGGADIGECLETAERINENDRRSWKNEWFQIAEKNEKIATECVNDKHNISAREAFLKASNYYRAAEFFLRDKEEKEEALILAQKSSECFEKACKLFRPAYERIQIPYEGTYLPGYYFKTEDSDNKKPTLIAMTGYDGTAEELYFYIGAAALKRGYNVLVFEGPGQGLARRKLNLSFRSDWEKVVTPVVDYLLQREDVDSKRIAMIGYSMGGYLVTRAAAYEHRIAACIANSGIYSFFDGIMGPKAHSKDFLEQLKEENAHKFNAFVEQMISNNLSAWWKIKNGLFTFMLDTPQQLMNAYRKYNVEACVDKIKCHFLICDSQGEHFFGNQSQILFDKLNCDKKMAYFTKEEGAELHCQSGAEVLASGRILDWLDSVL